MPESIYEFTVDDIDGKAVSLSQFRGQAMLIVNVASRCAFTRQYEGLQRLYETYRSQGLVVLGFPANDFLWQERKPNSAIKQFCTLSYGVTFPMFAKTHVRGRHQHPLYAYLTDKQAHPQFGGRITWNFNKFLVARDGRIVARFGARTKPESREVIEAIERAVAREAPTDQ